MPNAYELLVWTFQHIRYLQRRPGRSGYHTVNSGRGEDFIFADHGGRGGIVGRGKDTDQLAVPGRNKILNKEIVCYSYQQNVHYSDQCPNQNGTKLAHEGVILTQLCAYIKHAWVILDTCSTNIVSNNTDLVKEIRTCKNHEKLTVLTNRGLKGFDKKSTLIFFQ